MSDSSYMEVYRPQMSKRLLRIVLYYYIFGPTKKTVLYYYIFGPKKGVLGFKATSKPSKRTLRTTTSPIYKLIGHYSGQGQGNGRALRNGCVDHGG